MCLLNTRIWATNLRRWSVLVFTVISSHALAQSVLPDLVVVPSNIKPDTPTNITVTLQITDPSYIVGSAVVNELSNNGQVIRQLAKFVDDGTGGDLVAGDQNYTAQFTLLASQAPYTMIAASIAYKGLLKRLTTTPSVIIFSNDVSPTMPLATVEGGAVVFRDPSGLPRSTMPLLQYAETTTNTPDGPSVETRHETAIVSESQGTVLVLSHGTMLDANADEATTLQTQLRYFKSDGSLQFSNISSADKHYFIDEQRQILSRSGDRLLLVEVSDDNTAPLIKVLDSNGNIVVDFGAIADLFVIRDASITSNGRYVGLVGDGDIDVDNTYHIVVLDVVANTISQQRVARGSTSPYPLLAENQGGSFTLIIGTTPGMQLP